MSWGQSDRITFRNYESCRGMTQARQSILFQGYGLASSIALFGHRIDDHML